MRITLLLISKAPLSFGDVVEVLWGYSRGGIAIIVIAHEELQVRNRE